MDAAAPERRSRVRAWVAWVLIAGVVLLAAGGALLGAAYAPRAHRRTFGLSGRISARGGPFLTDRFGRVVVLHGVNVVYKRPPFEAYPDPGKPWDFGLSDVRRIQRLGFDVVRLGIVWQGLEPGTLPANSRQICTAGTPRTPRGPHQLDRVVLERYLSRLRRTVDLLGSHHIYTLLDMHQDVYSSVLGGEGAPRWAVCTDGIRPTRPPGRWSEVYGTRAADIAFDHFWQNDVVGDLQGQFDEVWGMVARYFRSDPWVIGFDPYNEPFSQSILDAGGEHFDGELECFYTGTAHVGSPLNGGPRFDCPPDDPRTGVIPTLLRNDPRALVFFEPDIYASRGTPTYLGPMDFPNLVFNVHIYCSDRSPRTGNPLDVHTCVGEDMESLTKRKQDRADMTTPEQPGGPAWFVSEFGATSNTSLVRQVTAAFDTDLVGWTYWSWKYYRDPTGSSDEALVRSTGRLRSTSRELSQTYAEAVAGVPLETSFDPSSGRFSLRYRSTKAERRRALHAPTLIVVPTAVHYAEGYCADVSGGRVVSRPDSSVLEVDNGKHAKVVEVLVTAAADRAVSTAGGVRSAGEWLSRWQDDIDLRDEAGLAFRSERAPTNSATPSGPAHQPGAQRVVGPRRLDAQPSCSASTGDYTLQSQGGRTVETFNSEGHRYCTCDVLVRRRTLRPST